MPSSRLSDAIAFATEAHSGRFRKAENTPYILHPMETASIVGGLINDEDVIIAGLLHDVVEDAGITLTELGERFGRRVAELVAGETEDKRFNLPADSTWQIRKEESLADLRNTDDLGLKILWLADKLANIRSFYRLYLKHGDGLYEFFHQKDKKAHAWYYRTVAEYVPELQGTAAYIEYVTLLDKIFGEEAK